MNNRGEIYVMITLRCDTKPEVEISHDPLTAVRKYAAMVTAAEAMVSTSGPSKPSHITYVSLEVFRYSELVAHVDREVECVHELISN